MTDAPKPEITDAERWRALAEMMDDPEASMAIDHGGWLLLVKCIDAAIREERNRNG